VSGEVTIVWLDPALRRMRSSVAEARCKGKGSGAESSGWELARRERAGVPVIVFGDRLEIIAS